jgi:hypothetical protein
MANVTEGAARNDGTQQDASCLATQGVLLGGTKLPVEIIGEAGTPDADREWIAAECPRLRWNWKFSGKSMTWAHIR